MSAAPKLDIVGGYGVLISEAQTLQASADTKRGCALQFIAVDGETKHPPFSEWPKLATSDPVKLERQFRSNRRATMLGLATGPKSGVLGFDVDYRNGGDKSLAALEAQFGPLPQTCSYRTPGGIRPCFHYPKGVTIPKRPLARGIDILGGQADGRITAQMVLPPSVRADGKTYEWQEPYTGFYDLAELPLWTLWLAIHNNGIRARLASIGVDGHEHEAFRGVDVAEWATKARELLRPRAGAKRDPLHVLEERAIPKVQAYLDKAIDDELSKLEAIARGDRDNQANTCAITIHGLLKGASDIGFDTTAMEDTLHARFVEIAEEVMGKDLPNDHWSKDKWERGERDADPRDLWHLLPASPDDEFDPIAASAAAKPTAEPTPASKPASSFKELDLPDKPEDLPARNWLLRGEVERGVACAIVGPGGGAKSNLANALAAGLGQGDANFIGFDLIGGPQSVLIVNNEDTEQELQRRIVATCIENKIDWKALRGKIHIWGPSKSRRFLAVVRDPKNKEIVQTPEFSEMRDYVLANKIALAIVDPLKSVHTLPENDNSDQDVVARAFTELASITNACVLIIHHARKGTSEGRTGDADVARGAGALINACRRAYTLFWATKSDGDTYGFAEMDLPNRVRLDPAKGNYNARGGGPRWYKITTVDLRNGEDSFALTAIDAQPVVPQRVEGIGRQAFRAALQAAVDAGQGLTNPGNAGPPAVPLEALRKPFADAYRGLKADEAKSKGKQPSDLDPRTVQKAWERVLAELPKGIERQSINGVDCVCEHVRRPSEHFDPDDEFEPINPNEAT